MAMPAHSSKIISLAVGSQHYPGYCDVKFVDNQRK